MFRNSRQGLARLLAGGLLGNRDFYDAAVEVLHGKGVKAFAAIDKFDHPILLHPRDRTITRAILRDGGWQREVFENFEKFITPRVAGKICFVDVGANIGSHSVYALHSHVFDEVVAIEANPELATILRSNFMLNDAGKKHTIFNVGAHSEKGSLRFSHNHRNIGGGSFRHTAATESEMVVEVAPLSELLATAGVAQSKTSLALWIDVEGHEVEVLKGAEDLFENHQVFLCVEITPTRLSKPEAKYLVALFNKAVSIRNASTLAEITIDSVLSRDTQTDIIACFNSGE